MSQSKSTDERSSGGGQDTLRDAGKGIDAPRLTPQGRTDPDEEGEDETSPEGGVKKGQPGKAEG